MLVFVLFLVQALNPARWSPVGRLSDDNSRFSLRTTKADVSILHFFLDFQKVWDNTIYLFIKRHQRVFSKRHNINIGAAKRYIDEITQSFSNKYFPLHLFLTILPISSSPVLREIQNYFSNGQNTPSKMREVEGLVRYYLLEPSLSTLTRITLSTLGSPILPVFTIDRCDINVIPNASLKCEKSFSCPIALSPFPKHEQRQRKGHWITLTPFLYRILGIWLTWTCFSKESIPSGNSYKKMDSVSLVNDLTSKSWKSNTSSHSSR